MNLFILCLTFFSTIYTSTFGQYAKQTNTQVLTNALTKTLDKEADKLLEHTISLRRDFHQNAELSNREFRTSKKIATYLQHIGLEVQKNIAKTGVVGILRGTKPSPVVALRADMDALPVQEANDLPFVCTTKSTFNGEDVPIMHACGHDTHMAILLTVAKILAEHKDKLPGTVKFIFQPAEEGPPAGEEGGAELMVKEGVLNNPKVDVIFGLHINAQLPTGTIGYKPGGTMASVNDFKITVKGKPAHGASPWQSIDPILTSAYIIGSLQSIVSRNVELTENAAVVTVGSIHGGVRSNIIPTDVEMLGTIRTLSPSDEQKVKQRFKDLVNGVANSMGAEVDIKVPYSARYPVTYNDIQLTEKMLPTLQQVAGRNNVKLKPAKTGAEDFSFYAEKIPGLFFFIGGLPKGVTPEESAPHHTPKFFIEEKGLSLGVKAFCHLVLDYMNQNKTTNGITN